MYGTVIAVFIALWLPIEIGFTLYVRSRGTLKKRGRVDAERPFRFRQAVALGWPDADNERQTELLPDGDSRCGGLLAGHCCLQYVVPRGRLSLRCRLPAADSEFFEKQIRPLLAENCYQCHGTKNRRAAWR